MRDMYSSLYTTYHAKPKPGVRPSMVTVSDAFTSRLVSLHGHWKRESPPGMPDCENLPGNRASQPAKSAHFPTACTTAISETLRVVHTACTAECVLLCPSLLLCLPRTDGVHGVHTCIWYCLYPLRAELTILGSMFAHCPTHITIWHSTPFKR